MVCKIKTSLYGALIYATLLNQASGLDYLLSDYAQLSKDLFYNYDLEVRPTDQCYVDLQLVSIKSLDAKSQALKTSIELLFIWHDERLVWDETNYPGINSIIYQQQKVWLPDMVVENSVDQQRQLGYDENKLTIYSDGYVFWSVSEIITTDCSIDVTYYPFDTQLCDIDINSRWRYISLFINTDKSYKIPLEKYKPSGTWELVDSSVSSIENDVDDQSEPSVRFTFKLKRRRSYYVVNLILPLLFLSFTASMVFLLPVESGEKVGLSISVLLAYTVYLTVVAEDIPQTSLQLCNLELYLISVLGITALSVVLTVTILCVYYMSEDSKVGPRTAAATRAVRRLPTMIKSSACSVGRIFCLKRQSEQSKATDERRASIRLSTRPVSTVTTIEEMNGHVTSLAEEEICVEVNEEITWKKVAETVDAVCFIVFTSLIILITLIFLIIMDSGGK